MPAGLLLKHDLQVVPFVLQLGIARNSVFGYFPILSVWARLYLQLFFEYFVLRTGAQNLMRRWGCSDLRERGPGGWTV